MRVRPAHRRGLASGGDDVRDDPRVERLVALLNLMEVDDEADIIQLLPEEIRDQVLEAIQHTAVKVRLPPLRLTSGLARRP